MLLFYQVATRLSLTTCWQIVELQDDNKLLEQKTCNKSVELNNLVTSCQQAVDNLSTSWEQAVRTHPDDKLLEQHCYKSAAGLLQLVRFYLCRMDHLHYRLNFDPDKNFITAWKRLRWPRGFGGQVVSALAFHLWGRRFKSQWELSQCDSNPVLMWKE
jgi:AraC-like DNA-binding protein